MTGQVLFDTNILIDWSKGYTEALAELAHWDHPAISIITWIELYGGANPDEVPRFDQFTKEFQFEVIEINPQIMRAAASLMAERRWHGRKIALPDAVIYATAQINGLTIITRNTKDFVGTRVRVPYELQTLSVVKVINVSPPDTKPASRKRKPVLTRKK